MITNAKLIPVAPYFVSNIDGEYFVANQREVKDANLPPFDKHLIFLATQREINLNYREIRIILPKTLEFKTYLLSDLDPSVHFEYIEDVGVIRVYKGIEGSITLFESNTPNSLAATFKVTVEDDNHNTKLEVNGDFDMLLS
ncbi:hypothetical protein [Pseudomonas mandelii]|uniref:hypothetical protein n=1 Tax=Pseudomonas mandelii TaxID=75612 RepID=UPI0020A108BA|nr:hypothetical protein [Pseudomonas mandelii]MCO8314182.1 hypothetical protein [Pseudomonas mandelii]